MSDTHDHGDYECAMCAGKTEEEMFLDLMETVVKHGWAVTGVLDVEHPFSYTTGLAPYAPELMIRGLSPNQATIILNLVAPLLLAGEIEVGVPNFDVVGSPIGIPMPILLLEQGDEVPYKDWGRTIQYVETMSQVDEQLRADGFKRLSVLWPDEQGRLPTDPNCDPAYVERQRPW